jgi:hypothetical protein
LANPTTNYGFVLPTATDLVTDLPADFDVALQGVDTRLKALNPSTTLGDIAYSSATANTNTRLAVGSTGQVLTVAAGVPSWATPAGTSGPAFAARAAAAQSLTQSVTTKVLFGTEDFDTAGDFASSRFTPTTAGYYQINTTVIASTNNAGYMTFYIYKNGAVTTRIDVVSGVTTYGGGGGIVIAMNGTTDYLEVYATLDGSGNPRIDDGSGQTVFSGVWIRGL